MSTDCVPIALLRQNKPFPLLYLGHAQIIRHNNWLKQIIQLLLIVPLLPKSSYYVHSFISLNKLFTHVTGVLYWNITPNSLSLRHCWTLFILHSSSTNPFYAWWVLCTFLDYMTWSFLETNVKNCKPLPVTDQLHHCVSKGLWYSPAGPGKLKNLQLCIKRQV